MGFNGTTFKQSIPSFGFRTTSCNDVLCIIMSFAQSLLLFSVEGILAYELMAGHPPFESSGCNIFCRTFMICPLHPPPREVLAPDANLPEGALF